LGTGGSVIKKLVCLSVLLFVFATHSSLTQDRTHKKPLVNFGEVMSGVQAGFTGGSIIGPVDAGFKIIDSVEFRVEYVVAESVATKAKMRNLPASFHDDILAGIKSWGAFLEPYLLAPGTHTANAIFHVTPKACAFIGAPFPCDIQVGPVGFEVIAD
jgi:hypothetical protein